MNATDVALGRLAAQITALPRGKHKLVFAPHMDMGSYVIIINVDKVALTGRKFDQKVAHRYSGRSDGLTAIVYRDLLTVTPERVVGKAVEGMFPHNSLGRAQFRRLCVYAGPEYPRAGQSPVPYELTQVAQ